MSEAPETRAAESRRTQAERRAESERRLLEASAELIVERGLENTSLADIGRRAGASHALVNHRFGSKDELVDRLVDEASAFYVARARERIGRRTGLPALQEMCLLYLDLVAGPDALGRVHVLLWSEAIAHTASRRSTHLNLDRTFRLFLANLIEDGIAAGEIDPAIEVDQVALVLVGALRGVAMQLLLDDSVDLAGAKESMVALLHGALATD